MIKTFSILICLVNKYKNLNQNRLNSYRRNILIFTALVLLTLYFFVIPAVYFHLIKTNCVNETIFFDSYVREYFVTFRNNLLVKGITFSIKVMKPLYYICITLFTLLVIVYAYEKHKRLKITMFFNIVIFSIIPVFIFSNTYGFYVFNQDVICGPFYDDNTGLFLIKYALNSVIVCSISGFYLVITFLKESTWKTIDLIVLEIVLCLLISLLFPMQLI